MATYKVTWKPISPLSTPLQSDTIFGHLCWAVIYRWGEDRLSEFINALKQSPCLVLSSAFPAGTLPKPTVPVKYSVIREIISKIRSMNEYKSLDALRAYSLEKKLKKTTWISQSLASGEYLYDIRKELTALALDEANKLVRSDGKPKIKQEIEQIDFHNMIDRSSGTTAGSGELFASPTSYYQDLSFESWLDTDFFSGDELQVLIGYIGDHGFGKDKNTGKGRFDISFEESPWPPCSENNAFLLLSNMVPCETDSTLVSYKSKAKFPKVGGNYALTKTPYKYPLYIMEPGSVFFAGTENQAPRGCLLQNVHPDPNIVQNLYAYSIPIMIKES